MGTQQGNFGLKPSEKIEASAEHLRLASITDHLRNSSAFQRTLGMLATTGVIDASSQKIVYASPALEALFGYLPGELIGHPIHDLLPPEKRAGHVLQVAGYVERPEPRTLGNLTGCSKTGRLFRAEIGLTPLVELATVLVAFTVLGMSEPLPGQTP